jgi:hypothetical protein
MPDRLDEIRQRRLEATVNRQETTIADVEAGIQTIITLLRDAQ